MKTISTLLLTLCAFVAFAQTPATQAPTKPVPTTTAPTLSVKGKTLCKEWKLVRTESFDLVQQPGENQKGDLINLMENGRYRMIMDGTAEGGTWTVDNSNVWVTFTSDSGVIKKFKIMSQTETELKVDYRDSDGTHNILIYGYGANKGSTK
jgi:hypothetical protein